MRRPSVSKSIRQIATTAVNQFDANYKKTLLPNGLRVLSEEIPYVRSVTIGVWIQAGSRDENESSNGISHFVEHMVFKGTKSRSTAEISRSIESVGGYLNAFTSKEHTCYYARVLDQFSDLAMDVLSDIVLNPIFPEKELEKEKGVVIEELRNAEDDPDDIIHDYLEKALYGSHPMGFPVIGREKNLRSLKRSNLVDYQRFYYRPSQMVIAAAGNIRHHHLIELATKYFSRYNTFSSTKYKERAKPKTRKGETVEIVRPIQQAHICIGMPAYSIRSKERYPLLVLNTLLGDGMSSRLFQNIRERYGFAYNVYSFVNLLSDTGSFGVYIGTDQKHIGTSIGLIERELHKLTAKPISKAELSRTKAQLKGGMMLSLENIPNRMMRLGSSELYFQQQTSLDSIIRQIDNITQDDLHRVANELFVKSRFSSVVFRPELKGAPSGLKDRSRGE